MSLPPKNILYFSVRISLGIIFVYAGFAKLTEPYENLRAFLEAYPAIPDALAPLIARTLPWIEFIFGIFMILGYAPRLSALVLGALLVGFLSVLAISRFVYGFSPEDCGCFGEGGIHLSVPQALVLDALSFAAAIKFARMREHPWSLDHWLERYGDEE